MSRDGSIVRLWGDEERTFRLRIAEWRKVQEKCDAGPGEIAARLSTWAAVRRAHGKASIIEIMAMGGLGRWRVDDVREPLFQGLIGGGMDPTSAGRLVRALHDERPLLENLELALAVVLGSLIGAEDEPVGEPIGEPPITTTEARSPEASSVSATTTEPAL